MDNVRKKHVNMERLSSGDIFALLESIERDDEGDIENIMNDSDTEFVAENESVISTNIIRKEENVDQSSSVSLPEASIHILSTQNEDETHSLGRDELNSAPATQRISISHFLLPLNVFRISHLVLQLNVIPTSHLLLPLNVLSINHLLLLLLNVLPIIHPNLLLLIQLVYPKTPRNGSEAR